MGKQRVTVDPQRLETALTFWRHGAGLAHRAPYPQRVAYAHAIAAVVATLAEWSSIPALVNAYSSLSEARWQALMQVCDGDGEGDVETLPLHRGIVEDAAFYCRYQVLAAQQGTRPPSGQAVRAAQRVTATR